MIDDGSLIADLSKIKKEEAPIKASCRGFAGDLLKLELYRTGIAGEIVLYNLAICENEGNATHLFERVKAQEIKFVGGEVTFCG